MKKRQRKKNLKKHRYGVSIIKEAFSAHLEVLRAYVEILSEQSKKDPLPTPVELEIKGGLF